MEAFLKKKCKLQFYNICNHKFSSAWQLFAVDWTIRLKKGVYSFGKHYVFKGQYCRSLQLSL